MSQNLDNSQLTQVQSQFWQWKDLFDFAWLLFTMTLLLICHKKAPLKLLIKHQLEKLDPQVFCIFGRPFPSWVIPCY